MSQNITATPLLAVALWFAFSSYATASPYQLAKEWLQTTRVARCFPGFIHAVSYSGSVENLKIPDVTSDIPVTPIEGHRELLDVMFPDVVAIQRYNYAHFLAQGILSAQDGFALSYDPALQLLAFNRTFGQEAGYSGMIRVSDSVPSFVARANIGTTTTKKGLEIGSPLRAVEHLFGAPSISSQHCGMKSVNYVSVSEGTVHEYLFIFEHERIVAMKYGGASD